MSDIRTVQLDCGLTLIAQRIPSVASAAINWLLPVGSAGDPEGADGHAAMLGEFIFRGAGGMTSREHSDALDRVGGQRSSHVLTHHLQIDATLVGERLGDALPLMTALVREPAMPAAAVDPVRSLCLQSLDALFDDPQHLAMIRLREQHLPPPFCRHGYGKREVLEAATREDLAGEWHDRCRPVGSILAVAGDFSPDAVANELDDRFAGWSGTGTEPEDTASPRRGYLHVEQNTAQVHIGLAYDAPCDADDESMLERVATAVLSGSTSGRLFTEVRQKRSLCYTVGASYRAGRDQGMVVLYAGTAPERAQETLDVSVAEVERLFSDDGITSDEFDRAVIGLKSHLIMLGESTPARAAALARDHFRLGRARTLDEIADAIDEVTLDALNDYVACRQRGEFTVVSVGPLELRTPDRCVLA